MIPLSLRFAARELRGGVRGFRIFLACLALGVAAIAAAGSTAQAFRTGLASEARAMLGGDVAVSSEHLFKPADRAAFASLGTVSYAASTRAMAQSAAGERRMVEVRGVDRLYPLVGSVELTDAAGRAVSLRDALAGDGIAAESTLLDHLHIRVGDKVVIQDRPFVVRGLLVSEPDRLTRGFALGPRVLMRMGPYTAAGLRKSPGFEAEAARLVLRSGSPRDAIAALRVKLPHSGYRMRERTDAAPGIRRLIDQLEYFLGFIGLSSLVAGGLGVAGAVSAYLQDRRPAIATLKALGARSGLIRNVYLIQILVLTGLGVALGLIAGAAAPFGIGALAGDKLPVHALFAVYPEPLERAAAFGLLAALAFSLGPLASARATPPAALFRRQLRGPVGLSIELLAALVAAVGLAGLAVWTAPTRVAAAVMIAGVAGAFLLLWLLGLAAAWAGGRLRGLSRGTVRVGLANLAGPRSAARTAAPAIGLGVALLACVVLIQSSLLHEVTIAAPQAAPALVFTDIPGDRTSAFDAVVSGALGPLGRDRFLRLPYATGRIIGIKGQPVDRAAIKPEGRWAFDRDLPMSAVGGEPPGADIEDGRWWAADYDGPPLIALEKDAAKAAGLKVGDQVTLDLLGREMDAKIAVLRRVNFGGFGPSFGVIVNAAALQGATLQNIALAKATRPQEEAVLHALAGPFPEVNVISVREQLEAATDMFNRLALAVRGAAAVAALAGLLVLVGAIAAGARDRAREAATLKVLGASRAQVLAAYGVEYGAVGLIAGAAGTALGYAAAWPVVVKLFRIGWSVDWAGVAALVLGAAALATLGGLFAAWRALAQRPAPVLRAE